MTRNKNGVSDITALVLEQIAQGRSYEQILSRYPDLTYLDIFNAAAEALGIVGKDASTHAERLAHIKKEHARAYEHWTEAEDTRLKAAVQAGEPIRAIAKTHQRQPSAIQSCIAKLGLADGTMPRRRDSAPTDSLPATSSRQRKPSPRSPPERS